MIRFTFFLIMVMFCSLTGSAQNIYGSSSISFNASANTGAADCETDLDGEADDGYYAARVVCVVRDPNGNTVASGAYSDDGDRDGYAAVSLAFPTTPGVTYTVTGNHSAALTVPYDAPQSQPAEYFDEFNFENYVESPNQDVADTYDWFGPGPQVETHQRALSLPPTTKKGTSIPTIAIHFTGQKASMDSLIFARAGVCSETLGPLKCSDYFRYSYEGQVSVANASQWTVSQTFLGNRVRNTYQDGTSSNTSSLQQADGPGASFLQNTDGKPLFLIDSPGTQTSVNGVAVVNSQSAWNFSVKVCNTVDTSACATYSYYLKIVVSNGALTSDTTWGQGSTSLNF